MDKKDKKQILDLITGTWFSNKDKSGEISFYKHLNSNKQNKLFEIILAGKEYDGIYELEIKKNFKGHIKDGGNEIVLATSNDTDYALFKTTQTPQGYLNPITCKAFGICIIRSEYKDEDSFRVALLETGLVTREEYDIYTFEKSKNYIHQKTPTLSFQ